MNNLWPAYSGYPRSKNGRGSWPIRPSTFLKEGGTMPQTRDAKGRWMHSILAADTVTGDKVVNRQKQSLGTIEHLMIDVENGRVAYAVLSFGGFLGMGDKLFAIPWSALMVDTDEEQFILDIDKQ